MADDAKPPAPLPPTPVLETPRLVLRPVRGEDTPAIQRLFPQWEVVRFLAHQIPWPYPADGAATNMAQCLGEMERREKLHWAITLKGWADELIGCIDLWPETGERTQRGFWLGFEFWGQGIMTEAAERVTEYAFMELGWRELWLRNAETNVGSHRVKEKQGAVIVDRVPAKWVSGEGMKVVWLLKREDWLRRREEAGHGG